MAIDITRDELRADILEITTAVVKTTVDDATRKITRMVDEDLVAVNDKIDGLDRRMSKRFDRVEGRLSRVEDRLGQVEFKTDSTNQLLRQHITDPRAHKPA